jgi:TrmH family RNA methyltransferase
MLSKVKAKYIKSLQVKKYRKQEQSFVVEGEKGVTELLASDFKTTLVCATKDFLARQGKIIPHEGVEVIEVTRADLESIGSVETNESVLAVAQMRSNSRPVIASTDYALVLDDIRDPGNLGTIVRTADWYGIKHVIASEETADLYNPKVIRSTMGSFCRVSVFYTALNEFLNDAKVPVYGAFMDGEDVHRLTFAPGGMIVIGNESNGISEEVGRYITKRITIPRFGNAESLNASIAAAVVLDNLRRR